MKGRSPWLHIMARFQHEFDAGLPSKAFGPQQLAYLPSASLLPREGSQPRDSSSCSLSFGAEQSKTKDETNPDPSILPARDCNVCHLAANKLHADPFVNFVLHIALFRISIWFP